MSVKERIMTIRLMEKLQAHPVCAKVLGLEVCVAWSTEAADKEK